MTALSLLLYTTCASCFSNKSRAAPNLKKFWQSSEKLLETNHTIPRVLRRCVTESSTLPTSQLNTHTSNMLKSLKKSLKLSDQNTEMSVSKKFTTPIKTFLKEYLISNLNSNQREDPAEATKLLLELSPEPEWS